MFAENFSTFFKDFGVQATLGLASVRGVFDNAFVDAGGLGAYGTQPIFTCASADLAGVQVGQSATVQATAYRIVGIEPDGTGVSVVRLERT
jgi:hypothetical protein